MRKIDLNLLRVLHALLQSGSVTQAAQHLGVSQPAVSRSLAQLRDQLGDPLLIKTNRGMAFTKRAEALRAPLEDWYAATRMVLRSSGDLEPTTIAGKFTIASTDFGVFAAVAPAMGRIMEQAPGLELEVVPLMPDAAGQLANGLVDIAITGFDPDRQRTCERQLFVESYSCVMRPGHPLAKKIHATGALPLDELARWPHFLTSIHGADVDKIGPLLADHGLSRQAALRVPYFSTIPFLLLDSDALAVLPSRAAAAFARTCGLVSIAFPPEMASFNYWLLWHERSRRDPVTMWIVEQLADAFENERCEPGAADPICSVSGQ